MNKYLQQVVWVCAVAGAGSAWAQHHDHAHTPPAAAAPSAPATATASVAEMAEGEVRRLDTDTGKVTLKHGPIKSLDMPPMTMVFSADKALLAPLKVGDKVRFQVAKQGGQYVVTAIQPAP